MRELRIELDLDLLWIYHLVIFTIYLHVSLQVRPLLLYVFFTHFGRIFLWLLEVNGKGALVLSHSERLS